MVFALFLVLSVDVCVSAERLFPPFIDIRGMDFGKDLRFSKKSKIFRNFFEGKKDSL